jgi:hypothetical protein
MHAIVRLNSFDPIKLDASPALEQFDQIHRRQPGYVGTMVVDLQAGRPLVLNLWESEEHSAAALSVGPEVGRLLEPLMSHPRCSPRPRRASPASPATSPTWS